jgi:hypothetical protein
MKRPAPAQTTLSHERGVLVLTIDHDVVRGVTPAMLAWWFGQIGGTMEYRGRTWSRYRVWHPRDHIEWDLVGPASPVGVGSRFRIVEAFGRNPDFLVDSTELVAKLDESGIRLTRSLAGSTVFSLEHWFEQVPDGTRYRSRMEVGGTGVLGRLLFNPIIRPRLFPDEMGRAWLSHNVEEVGNFEHFLPELYATRP